MTRFDPNQTTYAEGALRAERAARSLNVDIRSRVITSRDKEAAQLKKALPIRNVPKGFEKWQLPFSFDKGLFYITIAEPGAEAEAHAHEEGDGIRFIAAGSIKYGDHELKAGDWMFIPAGVRYQFKAGLNGATMCYCYCCSCAGRMDIQDWLGDPLDMKVLRERGLV